MLRACPDLLLKGKLGGPGNGAMDQARDKIRSDRMVPDERDAVRHPSCYKSDFLVDIDSSSHTT